MASLTGTQINNTYPGLLKFTDNLGVTGTPKDITDGLGGGLPMAVASDRINFTDTIDFSAATVLGLPGGAAGLVNGTGTNSLKNADDLVDTPAEATAANTVAIGAGAQAKAAGCVSIGHDSGGPGTTNWGSVSIGNNTSVSGFGAVCIGAGTAAVTGNSGIAIGDNATSGSDGAAIGRAASANSEAVAIGSGSQSTNFTAFTIGVNSSNAAEDSTAIGSNINIQSGSFDVAIGQGHIVNGTRTTVIGGVGVNPTADRYTAIGDTTTPTGTVDDSVAIGSGATINNATNAIALGVTATRNDFVAAKELELKTVGGGIIMASPDGTLYKLTIANGGTVSVSAV